VVSSDTIELLGVDGGIRARRCLMWCRARGSGEKCTERREKKGHDENLTLELHIAPYVDGGALGQKTSEIYTTIISSVARSTRILGEALR
jgi:hypothetical protein